MKEFCLLLYCTQCPWCLPPHMIFALELIHSEGWYRANLVQEAVAHLAARKPHTTERVARSSSRSARVRISYGVLKSQVRTTVRIHVLTDQDIMHYRCGGPGARYRLPALALEILKARYTVGMEFALLPPVPIAQGFGRSLDERTKLRAAARCAQQPEPLTWTLSLTMRDDDRPPHRRLPRLRRSLDIRRGIRPSRTRQLNAHKDKETTGIARDYAATYACHQSKRTFRRRQKR
ncbi:hypothetical protein C8Q70DRAFT_160269 [Cubamyces menziesii]|nr:hypothetical protein C8Q70DRAFT_160269 [Cubamyces menziesii]